MSSKTFTSYELSEILSPGMAMFAAAKLLYRTLSGIADDVERIQNATPAVLRGIRTVAVCTGYAAGIVTLQLVMWLIAAVRFMLPALPIVAKALCLTAIPVLAMYAVLTVPGLALCLVVLAGVTAIAAVAWK